jgi:hypothetical protein
MTTKISTSMTNTMTIITITTASSTINRTSITIRC